MDEPGISFLQRFLSLDYSMGGRSEGGRGEDLKTMAMQLGGHVAIQISTAGSDPRTKRGHLFREDVLQAGREQV